MSKNYKQINFRAYIMTKAPKAMSVGLSKEDDL